MRFSLASRIVSRLRLLRDRGDISRELDTLLSGLDMAKYRALADSFATRLNPLKMEQHFDLPANLRQQIVIARKLDLDRSRPLRILDLGTGKGLFPFVCGHYGHTAIGLDMPDTWGPFSAHVEFLGIDCRPCIIKPHLPLPDLGMKFDLITAFQICFNGHKTDKPWGVREWNGLLTDLAINHATHDARLLLSFNKYPREEYLSKALAGFFRETGAIQRGDKVFYPSLRAFSAKGASRSAQSRADLEEASMALPYLS
jgi:hypothetical protein